MKRLIAKGNKKAPKQSNGFYFFYPFPSMTNLISYPQHYMNEIVFLRSLRWLRHKKTEVLQMADGV